MPLDPAAEQILAVMAEQGEEPIEKLGAEGARAMYKAMMPPTSEARLAQVEDIDCPGPAGSISLRVYRPLSQAPVPVLMYFHGGGWVIGDLDTHDSLCRDLAAGSQSLVISVDYRLAPEHPYPAAPADCYAATVWASKNAALFGGDATRLAVVGDSAGGNLAAVISLMARDRGKPDISFQLLIYPVVDCTSDTLSYEENAEGYLLTKASMEWFWDQYVSDNRRKEMYASPLRATNLANLPPALLLTAEYDPLRDEGEAYGKRLEEAGVTTEVLRYDGMIHGFVHMNAMLPEGKKALDHCILRLQEALL